MEHETNYNYSSFKNIPAEPSAQCRAFGPVLSCFISDQVISSSVISRIDGSSDPATTMVEEISVCRFDRGAWADSDADETLNEDEDDVVDATPSIKKTRHSYRHQIQA
jgi:hypothetical protein